MAVTVTYQSIIDNKSEASGQYINSSIESFGSEGGMAYAMNQNVDPNWDATLICIPLTVWSTFAGHYDYWRSYLGQPKYAKWLFDMYIYNNDGTSSALQLRTVDGNTTTKRWVSAYDTYHFTDSIDLVNFTTYTLAQQWVTLFPHPKYFGIPGGTRSYYGVKVQYDLPDFKTIGDVIYATDFLKYAAWYGHDWSVTPTQGGTIQKMTMKCRESQHIYRTQGYTVNTITFTTNSDDKITASEITSKLQKDLIFSYNYE